MRHIAASVIAFLILVVSVSASAATVDYIALASGSSVYGRPEVVLQNAQTTGNGDVVAAYYTTRFAVVTVEWSAGTSAGAVTVEVAGSPTYAGTWASLATVNWSVASKADHVVIGLPFQSLRARISTNVVGGTVTVRFAAW